MEPIATAPKTPAQIVIDLLGGVRATARALGMAPSSVCRWTRPIEVGGGGGVVPVRRVRQVLVVARQRGLEVDAVDLLA